MSVWIRKYYREEDIVQLEKFHNTVDRWGLGAHKGLTLEPIGGDIGWNMFGERNVLGKLGLLKKIEGLATKHWQRK